MSKESFGGRKRNTPVESPFDFARRMERIEKRISEKPELTHERTKKSSPTGAPELPSSRSVTTHQLSWDKIISDVLADPKIAGQEKPPAPSTKRPKRTDFSQGEIRQRRFPLLDAEHFFQAVELLKSSDLRSFSKSQIAEFFGVKEHQIKIVRNLANLVPEVTTLTLKGRLSITLAARLAMYPRGVQLLFAEAFLSGKISEGELRHGFIHRHSKLTLRERAEMKGIQWPDNLDSDGNFTPKT